MKRKLSVFLDAVMAISCALPCQPHHRGVSPRITVTNNSSVSVALDMTYTLVDLSKLPGAAWGIGPNVASNEIAIGFQTETLDNQMPTTFNQTTWLQANTQQNVNIMSLNAYGTAPCMWLELWATPSRRTIPSLSSPHLWCGRRGLFT